MVEKYKLSLQKIGGSLYCLIPSGIVEKLNIKEDKEILATLEKIDFIRVMCLDFQRNKIKSIIRFLDKELTGIVIAVREKTITFLDKPNNYVIPIKEIIELKKEDKNVK